MHCVLLGVVPKLVSLWYDTKNHGAAYYLNNDKKKILDRRITSIKPPSVINRKPRTLKDKEKFKANEWRNLLLYYLRYSLGSILGNSYVEHFHLLSASVFILSKSNIHVDEVEKAGKMLEKFVKEFESLYGNQHVTMNVHLLRHIAVAIINSGPLWSQSMFAFEQSNGELVKGAKGYHHVLHQISEKYVMHCALPAEKKPIEHLKFCNPFQIKPSQTEKKLYVKYGIEFDERLTFYRSIRMLGEMYTSLAYKKTNSIDYFILLKSKQMGRIRYFLKFNESNYVLVELFETIKENDHLQEIVSKQSIKLFDIEEIQEKLIYVELEKRMIVSNIPNNYEKT